MDKYKVAGRARTLQERLTAPADTGERVESPGEWINEWRNRVADDNKEQFEDRLEIVGLSSEECQKRIRTHGWPADEPLPDWVHHLEDIINFIDGNTSVEIELGEKDRRPFTHLLSVIVDYAFEQLDHSVLSDRLSDTALGDLKNNLQDRLELFLSHPLLIEFKTFVASRDKDLVFGDDPSMPDNPHRYYDKFVEELSDGGLSTFFEEYSFLARLLETQIRLWVEVVEEFCIRLDRDYDRIVDEFGTGLSLGDITVVETLGDPHHGGRRVFCLTFESGTKVAYKPRSMEIEAAFNKFLSWVNAMSDLPTFKTTDYLLREEYGWMEWVTAKPCSTESEIEQYYRRAGALICLLYVSEFSDGHLENIVSVNDQPMVIDLETLAQPNPAIKNIPVVGDIRQIVRDSVLRTGLVPMHQPDIDISGHSGFGSHEASTKAEVREFQHINTDLMELKYHEGTTIEAENLPTLDGVVVEPNRYVNSISNSFEETYQFLQNHKTDLLQEDGPLACFTASEVRYVYRRTDNYEKIIAMMTTPSYLRTGLKFGCKVEALAKPLVTDTEAESIWRLYEGERDALRRGDVPRFSTTTDSPDLVLEGRTVDDFFEETSIDRLWQQIQDLHDDDKLEQSQYIKWGYGSHERASRYSEVKKVASVDVGNPTIDEQARRYVREIFDRIMANTKQSRDGDLTWVRRKLGPKGGLYVHSIKPGLYAGRMGIALFSAALDVILENEIYRNFTTDVISPVIEIDDNEHYTQHGIGGGSGLGSMIYGFTKLGELLEDDRYFEVARDYMSLLTPTRIDEDERYDVIDGSAGAVLSLLTLHDATGNNSALERAVTIGDHLLSNSVECNGTPIWQPVTVGRALTGFAHGTAGIAYALFRLANATNKDRFRESALASLNYENRYYDSDEQNWSDLRCDAESGFMDAWCHGRSGIGLARLGMADIKETEQIRQDIDRALNGVDPLMLPSNDHVCCGSYSRIEFLLRAGRIFHKPAYCERAERLAVSSIQRADARGRFETKWQSKHWYNPGFFQGESGIGYTLLRLIDPSLPCVLLWK